MKRFDLLTIGRCSLDLYSQQIGAPFVDIESFTTQVGGSPTNIAIGTHRLGLHSAAVTAVGDDLVGDFVRAYLAKEGIVTDYVFTKNGRTALAILGVEPPSHFPLVFYRDAPPDQYITIGDMKNLPLADSDMVLIAGSNFALPHLRDASLYAAKNGRQQGATIVIDLDLRPSLWAYPDALTQNMQTILPYCHLVIGTEEELWSTLSEAPHLVWDGQPVPTSQLPTLYSLIKQYQQIGQTIVLKQGKRGVTIFAPIGEPMTIPGFSIDVLNTVGAGDAFASGLLYGRQQRWDWQKSARFANACGAIVVTRHGCSSAMPTYQEVEDFIAAYQENKS